MKIDGLTNLPTHEAIADMLGDGSTPFGVFFDVDGLVHATHYFGYAHSDAILVRVAACIEEAAKPHPQARVLRIGGDEFLAVLPFASHDQAVEFAASVRRAVETLRLEYTRKDAADRDCVAVNAVVSRISAALRANVAAVREWVADRVWQAKGYEKLHVGVIADTGDRLPPWAA